MHQSRQHFAKMTHRNLLFSGHSDPSSEDEPLINLVKKRQAQSQEKTTEKGTKLKRLAKNRLTGRDGCCIKSSHI